MGYYWGDSWNNFSWFGGIMMIVFVVLTILIIVWLVQYLGGSASSSSRNHVQEKTALEILHERYAKGEIKKDEFEEKKKDLS